MDELFDNLFADLQFHESALRKLLAEGLDNQDPEIEKLQRMALCCERWIELAGVGLRLKRVREDGNRVATRTVSPSNTNNRSGRRNPTGPGVFRGNGTTVLGT